MHVIAIHPYPDQLAALADSIRAVHPGSQVWPFTYPMLAVKHGYASPADAVYTVTCMNRMSGFDVARLLRKKHPAIRVNFVAPNGDERQDAIRFDANSYMVAPVTAQRLRAAETEEW